MAKTPVPSRMIDTTKHHEPFVQPAPNDLASNAVDVDACEARQLLRDAAHCATASE